MSRFCLDEFILVDLCKNSGALLTSNYAKSRVNLWIIFYLLLMFLLIKLILYIKLYDT